MVDGVRVGVRAAAVAAILAVVAGIFALFSQVTIPAADVSSIVKAVSVAKAFMNYWAPEIVWMFRAVFALYGVKWTIFFLRYGVIAIKWLLAIWR